MERLLKSLLIAAMVLSTAASFALERCGCAHAGAAGAPPLPAAPAAGGGCSMDTAPAAGDECEMDTARAIGAASAAAPACICPVMECTTACSYCVAECNHRPPSGDNTFTMDTRRYSYRELKIQQAERPLDAPRSRVERIGAYLGLNSRVSSAPLHLASTVLLI